MKNEKHVFSCPIGDVLDTFSGRWKPDILWHLRDKPMRFNQLLKSIGSVSQKVLTQQLRELVRDGMVSRTEYEGAVQKVVYSRTELANSLQPIFLALEDWGHLHRSDINKARQIYDREN